MYSNTDITIYSYTDGKYTRSVIQKVFWDEVKQSNIIKSGMATTDSVKIFVSARMMPFDLKFTTGKDLVVKGDIGFEFDNSSPQTISASMKALKETYDRVVTVSVVDDKTYGSPAMQHYEISCK